jgi:hypothetical protein
MMVSRPAAAGTFGRARAEVRLAWGVDLHTSESGELRVSVADLVLIDPFDEGPTWIRSWAPSSTARLRR